jgi:hypothetical protein
VLGAAFFVFNAAAMDAAVLMVWGVAGVRVAVFADGGHASCLRGAAHCGFWHFDADLGFETVEC